MKLSERFGVSNVQWCHCVNESEVLSVCIYRGVCQRVRILRFVQCCVKLSKRLGGSTSFCMVIIICE